MSESTAITMLTKFSEFSFYPNEDYLVVRIFGSLDDRGLQYLLGEIEKSNLEKKRHVFVDCSIIDSLQPQWPHFLGILGKDLRQKGLRLVGLNGNERLKKFMAKNGIENLLSFERNFQESFSQFGLTCPKNSLDVKFINPFIQSMLDVLKKQYMVTAQPDAPVKIAGVSPLAGEVSAAVEVDCPNFAGVIYFSFPVETMSNLLERLTGESLSSSDPMLPSTVCEFANVSFSLGKKLLNEKGLGLIYSFPQKIQGKNLVDSLQRYRTGGVRIPITSDCGTFYFEIRL